jgi:ABC-type spermidine/putrescine transport system permease subunit I
MRIKWRIILRNAAIVIGLTLAGGLGVTMISTLLWKKIPSFILFLVTTLICEILGFFISGCLTRSQRWKYLCLTVIPVWVSELIRYAFGFQILTRIRGSEEAFKFAITNGIFALPETFIVMLVGGGLSVLLVRANSSTS